jgi:hypothetical protein
MIFSYGTNYYGIYDNIQNMFSGNFRGLNAYTIFIFLFVILAFVFLIQYLMSMPTNSGGDFGVGGFGVGGFGQEAATNAIGSDTFILLMKIIIIGIIIGLVLVNGLQYLYKIDFTTKVKGLFSNQPEIAINVEQHIPKGKSFKPIQRRKKQVFHIPGNEYSYEDAKALCKAYGAKIATLEQIEKAYNEGAEWCSYGWSDNQMAFFPTQRETWNKLQKIKGHKHDCGRPGINGGFIKNDKVRFGVNCYGYKPRMSADERKAIEKQGLYPKTMKDKYEDYKINHYRRKLKDIIIAPFNKYSWFQM